MTRKTIAAALFLLLAAPSLAQAPTPDMTIRELYAIIQEREKAQEQRFGDLQKALVAALGAVKEATEKSETSINERLKLINELRNTMQDLIKTFATLAVVDARFKALEEKLGVVETRQNAMASRSEGAVTLWGYIIGALGVLVAVAMFFRRRSERGEG